jgi:hypothetical protein
MVAIADSASNQKLGDCRIYGLGHTIAKMDRDFGVGVVSELPGVRP